MGNVYGYVRVSTKEQNEDRQLIALQEMSIPEKNIFVDKQSGKDFKRHSALDRMRRVEGWRFGQATVLCKGNVAVEDGVRYLPWYMTLFLGPYQPPKEMKYEIDLSALQNG